MRRYGSLSLTAPWQNPRLGQEKAVRNSDRKPVDEAARLHPNNWSSLEVRLIDCSATGFRAHSEARVRNRDEVTLEVPGIGPAKAYVIWVRGQEFGARFEVPIPIEHAKIASADAQEMLARLLVQRAHAHKSQLWEHEERLRSEIARTLPIHRT